MKYTDVPKRQRNGIFARLEKSIKKYGFENVRLVQNRYFKEQANQKKLQKEIREKEDELNILKGHK